MRRLLKGWFIAGVAAAALGSPVHARTPAPPTSYNQVLRWVADMVSDSNAQRLARAQGLNVLNVTWEDTGRYKNSAVGPNISDMTIQVQHEVRPGGPLQLFLMPVIRAPNFRDETGDVPLDQLKLLVGNERGKPLRAVTLREYLGNLRAYLHAPSSWKGAGTSLLADRDSHALVSAQAAFLPIPQQGDATFNPVLFNYQSSAGNPAVLAILATREGTSATIIDNTRDRFEAGQAWGQRLFFNANGQRASLTGKRLSDHRAERKQTGQPTPPAEADEGLNLVMLIQVPLKYRQPVRRTSMADMEAYAAPMAAGRAKAAKSEGDVEAAVIGHGALEGPFTELDNLAIERDPRFPVRVTVQFYKATSNGVVSERDMREIRQQIARVMASADYVGSLVTAGETGRPTEYGLPGQPEDKREPSGWWGDFLRRARAPAQPHRQPTWSQPWGSAQPQDGLAPVYPGFVAGPPDGNPAE